MEKEQIDPRELEKELKEFLGRKFGSKVQFAGAFPFQAAAPEADGEPAGPAPAPPKPRAMDFSLTPEQLEAWLDRYVVKQEQAKEILATKVCTHYTRIKLFREGGESSRFAGIGQIKNNILMIGPTGVGKTYLVKLVAKRIGIPFVKGDATKFSETGYVGGDVEDLVRDLVREADGDIPLAEHGIIYIDEIDKIASSGQSYGPDVSRTGVQRGLLKPMEETEVDLKVPHDMVSQMEALEDWRRTGKREKKVINTRNVLFILSGAFNGLDEIVRKRLARTEIGFRAGERAPAEAPPSYWLRHVTAEDLIAYGFESEFVGRLPVVVVFDPLEEEDLYLILRNPNCPVVAKKRADFKSYGIDVFFEDEALRKLAALAWRTRTGARGLASAVEATLLKFEKKLPSTPIRRLVVTPELVDAPAEELARILADPEEPGRAARFERLAAAEREELARALQERAAEIREREGVELDPVLARLAVARMVAAGTDADEAVRHIRGLLSGIDRFRDSFRERHGISLAFTPEARDLLLEKSADGDTEALCGRLFANLHLGLNLLREKVGRVEFTVDVEAVEDPDRWLNRLIRETYAQ